MKLLITGVSHKTAPVELREKLAFAEGILPHVLADLTAREGISEAMILSTCNRVEIIVSAADQTDPAAAIDSFLYETRGVSPTALRSRRGTLDDARNVFRSSNPDPPGSMTSSTTSSCFPSRASASPEA